MNTNNKATCTMHKFASTKQKTTIPKGKKAIKKDEMAYKQVKNVSVKLTITCTDGKMASGTSELGVQRVNGV